MARSYKKGMVFTCEIAGNYECRGEFRLRTDVTAEDIALHIADVQQCWHDDAGESKLAPAWSYREIHKGETLVVVSAKGAGPGRVTVRIAGPNGAEGSVRKTELEMRCIRIA